MNDIELQFQDEATRWMLIQAEQALADPTALYRAIAGALEAQTEANFEAQGRPSWVPLSKATIAERKKRNRGSSVLKVLQDSGVLAASISTDFGDDFARVGAATPYAAIHQLGGTINMPAKSTKVRLRTDQKGNLLRQGTEGSAKGRAVFARDNQKRARESWAEVGEHTITIPARPYLPFKQSGSAAQMQPEAETAVRDIVERMLLDAFT